MLYYGKEKLYFYLLCSEIPLQGVNLNLKKGIHTKCKPLLIDMSSVVAGKGQNLEGLNSGSGKLLQKKICERISVKHLFILVF